MIPARYTICLEDIKTNNNIVEVLANYEIYDEDYRETLNNKIINHYRFQEIAFETPFLFAHHLKVKLDEIMPKYNLLYNSEILKLDPLSNRTAKETMAKTDKDTINSSSTNSGSASSSSTSSDESNIEKTTGNTEKHVFQNTPQGNLVNEDINNFSYATTLNMDGENITENQDKSSNTTTTDSTQNSSSNTTASGRNSTENYIKTIVGSSNITTTKMLTEFVNNFNSIDKLIIDELYDLFMQIY